jgi:microsomal prostaglandin-E synthase 2
MLLRRLRTPLVTAGGLVAAGALDRAVAPRLKVPLSTAAAAGSIGSVHVYQYEVCAAYLCMGAHCTPQTDSASLCWCFAQICPFCNKVKALLDLHRLPYETTEVNPLTKGETKAWSGGYKKVPIAKLGGEQVNDSAVIAETLLDRIGTAGILDEKRLAEFRSPSALEWAKWSDEKCAPSAPCPHLALALS